MDIKIIKNIIQCEKLWNQFSPKKNLWDLWGAIIPFYEEKIHEPYFITAIQKNKEIGLLPLWYDKTLNGYRFFGDYYTENNTFWFAPQLLPTFFKHIPKKTALFNINKNCAEEHMTINPEFKELFIQEDHHYILNLKKINFDINNHLKTFNKKHRKNFLHDIKNFEKNNPKTTFEQLEHFEDFVNLNIKRFGEESDLKDQQNANNFKKLFTHLKENNLLQTCTIEINNKIEGIEFAAIFTKKYYIINGGFNSQYKNLGKKLILEHIKKATSLKADEIDFLSTDSNWKELWNFEKIPFYTLRKK